VADNVTIGDRAQLGAKTGAPFSVHAGTVHLWYPPMEPREAMRVWALLPRLSDLFARTKKLEQDQARNIRSADAHARDGAG
jgi:UDP-3-O-[3-hydroxymyristoyl] glucosamine N-acyltransferase